MSTQRKPARSTFLEILGKPKRLLTALGEDKPE
jgi:hypothetical protein